MKLTEEQQKLYDAMPSALRQETALQYIKNGYENGTLAYTNACKKLKKKPSKNPETSASEILSYPNTLGFLNSMRAKAAENAAIDAQWVLDSAKKVFDRCMQFEKVTDKAGEPVKDADGNPIYKFEPSSANKALEIIGKHVDIQAFKEKLELSGTVSIAERIQRAKQRDRNNQE